MKKLASTLPNMVASLGVITVVSAVLLGLTHSVTKEPIAAAAAQKQIDAIRSVAPPFDNDPVADLWRYAEGVDTLTVYPAYQSGQFVGAAVEGLSHSGFGGDIKVMYGFGADGTVTGYEVLSHAETPGLGSKMEEWFRDPTGHRSVVGIDAGSARLTVSKDGGDIDAITAATISSRAFLDALRGGYKAFEAYKLKTEADEQN